MQGLTFIIAFYWESDDESRAWSKRFFDLHKRMPTMAHAAIYSAVRHYLRAIEAAGTDKAKAVMARMREIPVNNFYAKNGRVHESRPHRARRVLRAGQNAGGIERPVGLLQKSCRPFRAIKLFVPWTKADVRWSNSDRRLCR